MARKDNPNHSSSIIPFIDMQDFREDSKYHAFEFVYVNFIPKGGNVPMRKLSKTELMVGKYPKSQVTSSGWDFRKVEVEL